MSENPALDAAVLLFGPERGHAIIGCDWGTKVELPDDREVCTRQARRRVVLHGPGGELGVKLCHEHVSVIERETDPHQDGVS